MLGFADLEKQIVFENSVLDIQFDYQQKKKTFTFVIGIHHSQLPMSKIILCTIMGNKQLTIFFANISLVLI